jgi:hypothetical protein
MYGCRVV